MLKKRKVDEKASNLKDVNCKGRAQHRLWKRLNMEKKIAKKELKVQEESKSDDSTEKKGCKYTVSIAVPGSILDNAQSPSLRSYLAGQIARGAAIFNVDEVVIFDDMGITRTNTNGKSEEELLNLSHCQAACLQMAHILQYLECPQYLRKHIFHLHKDLQYAGVLNPLDSIHHLREDEHSPYREGFVVTKQSKKQGCSYVYAGLKKDVLIDRELKAGVRVTIKMQQSSGEKKKLKGMVVAPHVPRSESGIYWGYKVRLAHSLGSVFTECPFPGGYDLTIGTSENGSSVDDVSLSSFKHLLIVFGGLKGLEASLEADEGLEISEPDLLFNYYLNTCPQQGSRTIRTEEAVLLSLSILRPKIQAVWSNTVE